ncbi:virulence RhuM family protein [Actinomyces oricola]|uniref:virulence RhuM family protein n=1 Tax=Actinomyces oricola TaxID=206043 RepID=UPI000FFE64EC|nr:virulence RhuM family protein [Actinomyces oricola]
MTQDAVPPNRPDKLIRNSTAEFLIFIAQEGADSIQARYEDETLWLTKQLMAELFGTTRANVSIHLRNIYESGELTEVATCKEFLQVRTEGSRQVNRRVPHYNLDAIISVGYRVNSVRATQFRQWATRVLRDFAIRGYVIDRERMANGTFLSEDYFERLLEELREIRLSERRFYQKVTDIYATSVDYNRDAPTTKRFFATVQNKLHYAVHGHTAAELIRERADADRPHMGLTTWGSSPDGKILRGDVTIGKNYLTREELEDLGRLVNSFLDLAESRARRHIPMTMEDWAKRLDAFLDLDDRQVLEGAGHISKAQADDYALSEFERFRLIQDRRYVSDFDRLQEDAAGGTARSAISDTPEGD